MLVLLQVKTSLVENLFFLRNMRIQCQKLNPAVTDSEVAQRACGQFSQSKTTITSYLSALNNALKFPKVWSKLLEINSNYPKATTLTMLSAKVFISFWSLSCLFYNILYI